MRDIRRALEVIGALAVTVTGGIAGAKWAVAGAHENLWASKTFDALITVTGLGAAMFLAGVFDLLPHPPRKLDELRRLYKEGEHVAREEKQFFLLGLPRVDTTRGPGVEWMRKLDRAIRDDYPERLAAFETGIDEAVLDRGPFSVRFGVAESELTEARIIEAHKKKLDALAALIEREQAKPGQPRASRRPRGRL